MSESLRDFVVARIGEAAFRRQEPKCERWIALYTQFGNLESWLEANPDLIGSKEYKEQVTAMNTLAQNIRLLENDLKLFEEHQVVDDDNEVLESL